MYNCGAYTRSPGSCGPQAAVARQEAVPHDRGETFQAPGAALFVRHKVPQAQTLCCSRRGLNRGLHTGSNTQNKEKVKEKAGVREGRLVLSRHTHPCSHGKASSLRETDTQAAGEPRCQHGVETAVWGRGAQGTSPGRVHGNTHTLCAGDLGFSCVLAPL